MIVNSFSQANQWFNNYSAFLELPGKSAGVDDLVFIRNIDGIHLYLGWAKGQVQYLSV